MTLPLFVPPPPPSSFHTSSIPPPSPLQEYESCPLQRLGANGEMLNSRGSSVAGSRRMSQRQSSSGMGVGNARAGGLGEGSLFHLTLNPGAQLPLELAYRPSAVSKQDFELVLQTLGNGTGVIEPIRKVWGQWGGGVGEAWGTRGGGGMGRGRVGRGKARRGEIVGSICD